MALTLHDIVKRLAQLDEITLLELLNITAEDIIERFSDVIDAHEKTVKYLEKIDELHGSYNCYSGEINLY